MLRLGCVLVALAGLAAAQGLRATVKLDHVRSADEQPFVSFPQRELALVAERPAECPKRDVTADARYAAVELGGKTLGLAFDMPEGALALGLVRVGDGEELLGRARPAQGGLVVDFADVPGGPVALDVRLQYEGLELKRAGLQPSRHRRGQAALGGARRIVILVDADADGRYDGPDDRWIALRAERVPETRALRRTDMLLLGEPQVPFETDGRALMVEKVAADGSSLDLLLDAPRLTREQVLRRRAAEVRAEHFERFARERESFAARNGIAAGRARAEAPAAWLDLPLSQGKEAARREGKPLLAFFYTESNPWSFRYDYYTFPDREVDELLRRFVLVRIDAEKDEEKSYAATGARGLPCLVPLTAEGESVSFRFRMRDEAGEVSDLKKEERMITGWQGPEEFAENLRRVLKAAD
jgi:hypothetical protein